MAKKQPAHVAQLAEAPASSPGCSRFESERAHQGRSGRALREVEAAANQLVDLWGLVEVGGNAPHEDRRMAERRLRRAVATLRLARLDGH